MKLFDNNIKAHNMELYTHEGERCYIDSSLTVYDFRINDERCHVIEPQGKCHKMLSLQYAVVIDSSWYTDLNIIDFIVWRPGQVPLSAAAASDNRVVVGILLTPDHWIYTDGILLCDVCGNQAKVSDKYDMNIGSILIFNELDNEEVLELGTLSVMGMFDDIINQAIKETHNYETS